MTLNKFFKNVSHVILAQVISVLATFLVSFIIPNFISVEEFGYWHLFLFYVTYINLTRLGVIDGIYLKLTGKKRNELDKDTLGKEWLIFTIFQIVIAIIFMVIIFFSNVNADRKFIFYICCGCMILINSKNFLSYIFQAINEVDKYSNSIIIENIAWFVAVFIVVFFKIYSYKVIIVLYVIGHIISSIYLYFNIRKNLNISINFTKDIFLELKDNIKCGFPLMMATFINTFIIGISKIIIDNYYGIETFAYFSFSIVLSNFILNFVKQINVIIFPTIKHLKKNNYNKIYSLIQKFFYVFSPMILLLYFPISLIIKNFLPQYFESVGYLIYFIPICVIECRMQIICETYFKILRKEKQFFIINLLSLMGSFLISIIGVVYFKNIYVVVIGLLFIMLVRDFISEIIISNHVKFNCIKNLLIQVLFIILFIFIALKFTNLISFILYLIILIIYSIYNKKNIKDLFDLIKKRGVASEKR